MLASPHIGESLIAAHWKERCRNPVLMRLEPVEGRAVIASDASRKGERAVRLQSTVCGLGPATAIAEKPPPPQPQIGEDCYGASAGAPLLVARGRAIS